MTSENDKTTPPHQDEFRDELGRYKPGYIPPGAQPWKPGQCGNPKKIGTRKRLTKRLLAALDSDDGALADALVKVIIKRALRGDFRFFQELYNRAEGKVADRLAGADGETLKTYINVDVSRVCRKQPEN